MTGPSVGSTFAGCRIDAVAGRGGMGVVYKAAQVALDRPVALKVIAPEVAQDAAFQERFKHEARLAASIDHPNVVPIYESGEIDGQLYLVMRWVDGVDLRALIDQGPPLTPERAARIAAQVASALGAAHGKGLLHRDIKPANVLVATVDDSEHAYLTDFGIARYEAATSGLTRTGMMVGTVDYMPPERIEGHTGDARSDVYSLGCALYELLTGHPPYMRENEGARIYAHLSAEVPSATDERHDVPDGLAAAIRRAMAKRPEDRFQTAGEMSRAVMTAVTPTAPTIMPRAETRPAETRAAAPTPPAPPAPAAPPPPRPFPEPALGVPPRTREPAAGRRRLPLVLAGAAGLIALVAILALASGGGDDDAGGGADGGGDTAAESGAPAGVPIPVRGNPDGLEAGAGTVWVTGAEAGIVTRLDAGSGDAAGGAIPVGEDPDTIAVGDDAVWVTNNDSDTVSRIDPDSGEVVAEIDIGRTPQGIALDDAGAPWVALLDEDGVRRIDPATNDPGPVVETGDEPYAVLVDGQTVWVTNRGGATVSRFEAPDGDVESFEVGGRPRALAVEGSSLWVLDFFNRLVELDSQTGRQLGEIPLQGEPREMVAAEGALWITLYRARELAQVDPATGDVTTRSVRGRPIGITAEAGRIWVGVKDNSTVTPFAP